MLSSISIGLWSTGRELYSQMRPKSTGLDQMDKSICGKRRVKGLFPERLKVQSSLEEVHSWFGDVQYRVEWCWDLEWG